MEEENTSETLADLEIRKLNYGQIGELIQILDFDGSWKKLMNEIRSDCFNLEDRKHKYNINDINTIEKASQQYNRPCAEIFLDEWGTSGKKRPTVHLLHQYLQRAKLKRAAIYVAEKLMRDPRSEETTLPIDSTDLRISPGPTQDRSTILIGADDATLNGNERFNYPGVTKVSYRVLERITNQFDDELMVGHGAFGAVYKGKEDKLEMAIKKLSRDATEHFQHELLILLTGIKHKNLLPPLAISDEYDLCLVYEFMPHGSLEDRLALKNRELQPLSWDKRVFIAFDICEGLKYLHDQPKPIIHRDIKSSNILLDENDVAKIGDFGLIRINNDSRTMNTNVAQGTTAYMAPEYFRGVISMKLDVYSFGVILLELLTGLPSVSSECHLVEYLDDRVDPGESVEPVLDEKAGLWDMNIADKLHDLARQCLDEKKSRPETDNVHTVLQELTANVKLAEMMI